MATPKVSKVTCLRKCASKQRARGGSVLKIVGTELAGVNAVTYLGSYGSGDDTTVKVRAGSNTPPQRARADRRGDRADRARHGARRALRAHEAGPHPPAAAARAERRAVAGAGTGRERRAAAGDRHEPDEGVRRRAPGRDVLVPPLGRVGRRAQGRAGERGRRAPRSRPGRPQQVAPDQVQSISWNGRLGRAAARPGRYSFRLTAASADGAEARNSQAGDIEPRLVRPLRQHLPGPRPPRLRRRGRAVRRRPRGAHRTRATTCSPSAARAWSPPAAGA